MSDFFGSWFGEWFGQWFGSSAPGPVIPPVDGGPQQNDLSAFTGSIDGGRLVPWSPELFDVLRGRVMSRFEGRPFMKERPDDQQLREIERELRELLAEVEREGVARTQRVRPLSSVVGTVTAVGAGVDGNEEREFLLVLAALDEMDFETAVLLGEEE